MSVFPTKEVLLTEIRKSRLSIELDLHDWMSKLNVIEEMQCLISTHSSWFIGGAAVVGFLLARFFFRENSKERFPGQSRRKGGSPVRRSFTLLGGMLACIRTLLSLVKPEILAYVGKKMCKVLLAATR